MADQNDDRTAIGNRLRAARENAGVTQGQVAAQLGLHRPAIAEIEAGRRKVPAEELKMFCELYEVSASWLLNGRADSVEPAVELAARKLARLKPDALESVLDLLRTLKDGRDDG